MPTQTFHGPLGPWPQAQLTLEASTGLTGHVRVQGRELPLPELAEPTWSLWELQGVSFEARGGQPCAVIHAEYMTGVGAAGAQPFPWSVTVAWSGSELVLAT